jgi:hypothetical protein
MILGVAGMAMCLVTEVSPEVSRASPQNTSFERPTTVSTLTYRRPRETLRSGSNKTSAKLDHCG